MAVVIGGGAAHLRDGAPDLPDDDDVDDGTDDDVDGDLMCPQAALLIYAMVPLTRRLEKLNTQAISERNLQNHQSYWGFKIFRDKFIEVHGLPNAFLFDLYHLQSYKVCGGDDDDDDDDNDDD
jgi:hypothetical protein